MNKSESIQLLKLRRSQELLKLDAIDIRFRVYDLLFACYPELSAGLPQDRYRHPDIVSLLLRRPTEVETGAKALNHLLEIIAPRTENELVACLMLFKQCLIRALQDILSELIDDELISSYQHLIESRMINAVGRNPDRTVRQEKEASFA